MFFASLESSWLKTYFFRFFCFERIGKNLQQCLFWTATKRLYVINLGHKLQRRTLYDTRQDVHSELFIALNVPTFQQPHRMTFVITLLRNLQHPEWKLHTSVNYVSKIFLAFMRCDNTRQASEELRWKHLNLTRITSLKMTTQNSRENSKLVNISSLTLSVKKEDIVF